MSAMLGNIMCDLSELEVVAAESTVGVKTSHSEMLVYNIKSAFKSYLDKQ